MEKIFQIITLGCKVNRCESDALDRRLGQAGGRVAGKGEAADLCVINTCAVTSKAAMQSRQAVRRAIRENPGARIVVTGCHAQTEPETIRAIHGVDQIVGYRGKAALARLLSPDMAAGPGEPEIHFSPLVAGVSGDRTRPFLKIQDGCDAFCTYCIVPHARGRSRSMPLESVKVNLAALAAAGYREAVLTGIHLGMYGRDLSPPVPLIDLLKQIETHPAPDRIRLSSIEPAELTGDVIGEVADGARFCPHFHIPLQSGDDGILKRMRRPYTAGFFSELVRRIVDRMPDAAIGVDVLIGFPGETRRAFENTYAVIDALPVSYLHVFPFSARPGTPAAHYPCLVPAEVIKERCRRLRALSEEKKARFYRRHVGRVRDVLVETRRDRETGRLKGLTANYIEVQVDGDDTLMNRLVPVRMVTMDREMRVTGTVVESH